MKKGFFRFSLLSALVLACTGFAATHNHELCEGFVPDNTMRIPVGEFRAVRELPEARGISEAEFNAVIDRAERLYAPVIQAAGGTLTVKRLWTNATVNASAQQQGTSWIVNMYGGLARHAAINVEGFALVICHEIGHHIGGAPKGKDWFGGSSWATNEGGSDYFATLKCLRNYFAEDDNETIIGQSTIDPVAKERCEAQFTERNDQLLCMRSSMAATSVAYLFMDLKKEKTFPKFDTPDPKVVTKMFDAHPATQCRMDTYIAGATCNISVNDPLDNADYKVGSCFAPDHTMGVRPLCWFKPD